MSTVNQKIKRQMLENRQKIMNDIYYKPPESNREPSVFPNTYVVRQKS